MRVTLVALQYGFGVQVPADVAKKSDAFVLQETENHWYSGLKQPVLKLWYSCVLGRGGEQPPRGRSIRTAPPRSSRICVGERGYACVRDRGCHVMGEWEGWEE